MAAAQEENSDSLISPITASAAAAVTVHNPSQHYLVAKPEVGRPPYLNIHWHVSTDRAHRHCRIHLEPRFSVYTMYIHGIYHVYTWYIILTVTMYH